MGRKLQERRKIATVEKWRASGLTQAEFCRRDGLPEWQLSGWKRFVEVLEKQAAKMPAPVGRQSGMGTGPRARKERKNNGHPTCHPGQAAPAEAQPFVPVRLVDVVAEDGKENGAASVLDTVLEVVLKRGRIVRVTPGCEPQFLCAVVSALELL